MTETINNLKAQIRELESRVAELEIHEQQLNSVIQCTGVGIWDWDIPTGKTVFNERWANIIGYSLAELEPISIETWIKYAHPEDLITSEQLLKQHWDGKTDYYICESRMKHKNGQWIWVYDTGQVVEWMSPGVPKRMIGTHLDITKNKLIQEQLHEKNKKLKELSYLDGLTCVPNRRAFDERLIYNIYSTERAATPLSMLMLDIDYFKQYNDIYGHELGDIALKQIASTIQSLLNRKTDMVARYGGEEFVILLPDTPLESAVKIASKIIENILSLDISHSFSSHNRMMTVSIGVSSTLQTKDKLLLHADRALYAAKGNGRNRFEVFTDEQDITSPNDNNNT